MRTEVLPGQGAIGAVQYVDVCVWIHYNRTPVAIASSKVLNKPLLRLAMNRLHEIGIRPTYICCLSHCKQTAEDELFCAGEIKEDT